MDHAGGCVRMVRFKEGHFLESPVDERMFNPKVHPMINSADRDGRNNGGEVDEVREALG